MHEGDGFVRTTRRYQGLSQTPGDYTVEITGDAVQGDLTLFAHVDYHSTFEETKVDHLKYKVGGCPGFT